MNVGETKDQDATFLRKKKKTSARHTKLYLLYYYTLNQHLSLLFPKCIIICKPAQKLTSSCTSTGHILCFGSVTAASLVGEQDNFVGDSVLQAGASTLRVCERNLRMRAELSSCSNL